MAMSNIPYLCRYVRSSMWQTLRPTATGTFNSRRNSQMPHTTDRSPNYQQFSTVLSSARAEPRTRYLQNKSQHTMSRKSYPQPLRIQQKCNRAWRCEIGHSLSLDEEIVFSARLSKIWEGLMTFPMTTTWEHIVLGSTKEEWLSRIHEHTPAHVKSVLASPTAPTLVELKSLGWTDTFNAGVFMCILSKRKRVLRKKASYLYLGSASKNPGGLSAKRRTILLPSQSQQPDALKSKIAEFDLLLDNQFIITLFEVPFNSRTEEEMMQIRALVTLARYVFMIWLGAVDKTLYPAIRDLVPWESESIEYLGLARDPPFATDLNGFKKS